MSRYQSQEVVEWAPLKRTVPMKVLVVGFWRTGTTCEICIHSLFTFMFPPEAMGLTMGVELIKRNLALKQALEDLGYHQTFPRNSPNANYWNSVTFTQACNKAIDDKFVRGQHIDAKRLDELFGDCMVLTGMPCILFLDEVIAAYPEAKVILTTRNVDEWHHSLLNTFDYITTRKIFPVASLFDGMIAARTAFFRRFRRYGWFDNVPLYGKRVYTDYVAKVRLMVEAGRIKKERYMELPVGSGWGPICAFLGEEEPRDTPYPHAVTMDDLRLAMFPKLEKRAWIVVFKGVVTWSLPPALVLAGFWWARRLGR